MIDAAFVAEAFRERHRRPPRLFRAPGRVNLIGEHTDYNDGFVLPIAIDRDTVVAAAARSDRQLHVTSLNRGEEVIVDLDAAATPRRGTWADYVEGMARVLEERAGRLAGADLVLQGDVPEGSGLSSSASLEMACGLALAATSGVAVAPRDMALAGQEAEHRFVGTRCGIMDQMVSVMARAGHALLIDCRSLECRPVALSGERVDVLVCDSGVRHRLADGEYNRRREECEEALRLLSLALGRRAALRDVSADELQAVAAQLPPPLGARARHVVWEIARTEEAAQALEKGELRRLGRLMADSHRSLRDDYAVSAPELDALVEAALGVEGVLGSRMTGGGFGGCTVTLARPDAVVSAAFAMRDAFVKRFGRTPAWFVTGPAGGAAEVGEAP